MSSPTCITCAKVWTGADSAPDVALPDTILFFGDRIVAVGTESEISLCPEYGTSEKIRLAGTTIIPGLADSHLQFSDYARQGLFVDLSSVSGKAEMLRAIAAAAESFGSDDWICGFNFSETEWNEPVMPDRHDLDSLDVPNPILVQRICGHVTILNGRAISLCSVDRAFETEGVQLGFDGEPTGRLIEDAQSIALTRMVADMFDRGKFTACLKGRMEECASHGLTALFVCGTSRTGTYEHMDIYQELLEQGDLKVRVFCYSDEETHPRMSSGFGSHWIGYQGYKLMLDGSLGARTAALSSPYSDFASECGTLLMGKAELVQRLERLADIHCQAKVHVIGDAALDLLLDAVAELGESLRSTTRPPIVVNHCMICRPDQIARMKDLGLAASVQPSYVSSERVMATNRLGERIEKGWAYPWKSLTDAGIVLCGASDSPFAPIDPWDGIWSAVERETARGVWMPEQCLSLEDTLRMYTVNSALVSGTDSWRGTLETGKVADMVVLDRDIFTCAPTERRSTRVVCTIAGGRVTYGSLA